MIGKLFNKANLKLLGMGGVFFLVNFTSIVVITQILGLNLPVAFLMSGIGTIIYHLIIKNRLCNFTGISGLYVGGMLLITEKYSIEYALGGVVMAGILYLIFGLIYFKWQDKIMNYIPQYIISISLLLIGLNLLPIGVDLVSENLLVGGVAVITMLLIELFGNKNVKLFSMPISILAATIVFYLFNDINTELLSNTMQINFISPKFNIESFFTVSLLMLGAQFEIFGDTDLISKAMKVDQYKEVGFGRIFTGIGITGILNGFAGAGMSCSYSESNSAVIITDYKNPNAQIVAAVLFILLAINSNLLVFIQLIPMSAFGGVLTLLFATIIMSAIRQLINDKKALQSNKSFLIMATMVSISFITFIIGGINISSIAIATIVGIVLNTLIGRKS